MSNKGWIKLQRSVLDSLLWQASVDTFKLGVFVLLSVAFQEQKAVWYSGSLQLKRGELMTSISHLAQETGLSIRKVRTTLSTLGKVGFLTQQPSKRGTLLTLCPDWVSGQYGIFVDKQDDKPATNGRHAESCNSLNLMDNNERKNSKNFNKKRKIIENLPLSDERLKFYKELNNE